MTPDSQTRSREILDRIDHQVPPDNARLKTYISALRDALDAEDKENEERERIMAEYEEAYKKLTAPANRIGVFLNWHEEEHAYVAVGDSEFVVNIDPSVDRSSLQIGARVRVNEAYAIVGIAPYSVNGPVLRVGEVLEDGRIRLGAETPGSDGRLVLRSNALVETKISAGDEVRTESSGRVAIEHFPKGEQRDYFFEDVPEIPWENVGGQEEAIRLIKDTIEQPLLYPEIYRKFDKKPIKGILLYGPPGCGKTLIGKATAFNLTREYSERVGHEVKEYFMYISGPKILNMWLGETERMVRDIFRIAREKAKEGRLVFIFIDEAESVLRTRSSGRWLNISNTVVPQFCAEMDGLVSLENVVLILTSNRPDYIDPAVLRPERIDRKVKIGRPSRSAAEQIFGIYLHANIPIDPSILKENANEIDCARKALSESATSFLWQTGKEQAFLKVQLKNGSSETLYWKDLVSGALIKSVVDRAKDKAIARAISDSGSQQGISLSDLEQSIIAEYKENEIFPKTDTQDDWLKLLDYEPENVAVIRPIGIGKGEEIARKGVI